MVSNADSPGSVTLNKPPFPNRSWPQFPHPCNGDSWNKTCLADLWCRFSEVGYVKRLTQGRVKEILVGTSDWPWPSAGYLTVGSFLRPPHSGLGVGRRALPRIPFRFSQEFLFEARCFLSRILLFLPALALLPTLLCVAASSPLLGILLLSTSLALSP